MMTGALSALLVLACPLGMLGMMVFPALVRRFGRTTKPADGASSVDQEGRALAHQGR
jgi:hypothetical protein